MSLLEKLDKSIDVLKNSDVLLRSKEKAQHCVSIADILCSANFKSAPNFAQRINVSISLLIRLCNDEHSDIRMVACENLDRIIRALSGSYMAKIQLELFEAIKQCNNIKSVRIALTRFAKLSVYIKPQKGKVYVANLFPCLENLLSKPDDLLHETFSESLPKIIKSLGLFATDKEMKSLIKSIIEVLKSDSPVRRRCAAQNLSSICTQNEKTEIFIDYVLNMVFDLIVPFNESLQSNVIVGALNGLKLLLPVYYGYFNKGKSTTSLDQILQIFELCLHYINVTSSGNTVITNAALETLNYLLFNAPKQLINSLISTNYTLRLHDQEHAKNMLEEQTASQMSISNSIISDIGLDYDLSESILENSISEDWVLQSKLTTNEISLSQTDLSTSKTRLCSVSNQSISDSLSDHSEYVQICNLDKTCTQQKESGDKNIYCNGNVNMSDVFNNDLYIGDLVKNDTSLIMFCVRLITHKFLLTGFKGFIKDDKNVKVTLKYSALCCLCNIVKFYPNFMTSYLDLHANDKILNGIQLKMDHFGNEGFGTETELEKYQTFTDLLLFSRHPDQQLRGVTNLLIGQFITTIDNYNTLSYEQWCAEQFAVFKDAYDLKKLICILIDGLKDDIQTATRQSLQAVEDCLRNLIRSSTDFETIKLLLNELLQVSKKPYWLIKVKLAELLSKLNYKHIYLITGSDSYQEKILHDILYQFLSNEDSRVRSASTKCLCEIIPKLYYSNDYSNSDPLVNVFVRHRGDVKTDCDKVSFKYLIDNKLCRNLMWPFCGMNKYKGVQDRDGVEKNLSRVLFELSEMLCCMMYDKNLMMGVISALAALIQRYNAITYGFWLECISCELLQQLIQETSLQHDLNLHKDIIIILTNLICASQCKEISSNSSEQPTSVLYETISDLDKSRSPSEMILTLESHLLKILNAYRCVIEGELDNNAGLNIAAAANSNQVQKSIGAGGSSKKPLGLAATKNTETESPKKQFGYFANNSLYMKLYEALKSAYSIYKTNIDDEASTKFLTLLDTVISSISQLLEVQVRYISGSISDEILLHTRWCIKLCPKSTILCVEQLLRALFKCNLVSDYSGVVDYLNIDFSTRAPVSEKKHFEDIFTNNPYKFVETIQVSPWIKLVEDFDAFRAFLKKRQTSWQPDKKFLSSSIRLFEPMVIECLKKYTTCNNTSIQARVLSLLCQLLHLRVNYKMLDSENTFIQYVFKQFDSIQLGQVADCQVLLEQVFSFLLRLSSEKCYEDYSNRALHLCDELLASEQNYETHCVPALVPLVEAVFFMVPMKNGKDFVDSEDDELLTKREVVFSMVLRLLEYSEIQNSFSMILILSFKNKQIYNRRSQFILDHLLNLITNNKIKITTSIKQQSLQHLIETLSSEILLRNIQEILKLCMNYNFYSNIKNFSILKIFLATILATLPNEKQLLQNLDDLKLKNLIDLNAIFFNKSVMVNQDPLQVLDNPEQLLMNSITNEVIFVRFLFCVIYESVNNLKSCFEDDPQNNVEFICEEFEDFLKIVEAVFDTDRGDNKFKSISKTISTILSDESLGKYSKQYSNDENIPIEKLTEEILFVSKKSPYIYCHWLHLLVDLNWKDWKLWKNGLEKLDDDKNSAVENPIVSNVSINTMMLKRAAFLTYCRFSVKSNQINNEKQNVELTHFLGEHLYEVISFCYEEPVIENILQNVVFGDEICSEIILQAVDKLLPSKIDDMIFVHKVLTKFLDRLHVDLSGSILHSCIVEVKLLEHKNILICRDASRLCSSKAELLRTLETDDSDDEVVVKQKLSEVKFRQIMEYFRSKGERVIKRHETLVSILNKLAVQFYSLPPIELDHMKTIDFTNLRKTKLDAEWFYQQVKTKCCSKDKTRVEYKALSKIMQKLGAQKLQEILSDENVDVGFFAYCLTSESDDDNVKIVVDCLMSKISVLVEGFNFLYQNQCVLFQKITKSVINLLSIDQNLFADFVDPCIKFNALCLQYCVHNLKQIPNFLNSSAFEDALTCFCAIIKTEQVWSRLNNTHNLQTQIHNYIASLHQILQQLSLDATNYRLIEKVPNLDKTYNNQVVSIIQFVEDFNTVFRKDLNKFSVLLTPDLAKKSVFLQCVIMVCRFDVVIKFAMTPFLVFERIDSSLDEKNYFAFLQEFLQDSDVLESFVFRCALLGWTSRTQFEETWMSLLGVISGSQTVDAPSDEVVSVQTTAIRAITNLLLSSLLLPKPGNTVVSSYLHISRNDKINEDNIVSRKLKPIHHLIQSFLEDPFQESSNLDRTCTEICSKQSLYYPNAQISSRYLKSILNKEENEKNKMLNEFEKVHEYRMKCLQESGIDLESCLQFLVEMYSHMLNLQAPTNSIVVHSILESLVSVSDLFTKKSHFEWCLNLCLDMWKRCSSDSMVNHDEIAMRHLVSLACKCCSVFISEDLGCDALLDIVNMLRSSLRSSSIPRKTSSIPALMCLIEVYDANYINEILTSSQSKILQKKDQKVKLSDSKKLSFGDLSLNLTTTQDNDDVKNVTKDFVGKEIEEIEHDRKVDTAFLDDDKWKLDDWSRTFIHHDSRRRSSLKFNETRSKLKHDMIEIRDKAREYAETVFAEIEQGGYHHSLNHLMSVYTMSFLVLEKFSDSNSGDGAVTKNYITSQEENNSILNSIIFVLEQDNADMNLFTCVCNGLERLVILDKLPKQTLSQISQACLKKIKNSNFTYVRYTLKLLVACMYKEASTQLSLLDNASKLDDSGQPSDLDLIVDHVEKISTLFERLKVSNRYEARVLCQVLSKLLNDLFQPSEMLAKVIGEFFSITQQQHGDNLALVLLEVFENLISRDQHSLLQSWLVCSLANLANKLPANKSLSCLVCVFVAASLNSSLKLMFPYVVSRFGKFDFEDKVMLCLATRNFFEELVDADLKKCFVESFRKVRGNGDKFDLVLKSLE